MSFTLSTSLPFHLGHEIADGSQRSFIAAWVRRADTSDERAAPIERRSFDFRATEIDANLHCVHTGLGCEWPRRIG